jgi:hypothetical protein
VAHGGLCGELCLGVWTAICGHPKPYALAARYFGRGFPIGVTASQQWLTSTVAQVDLVFAVTLAG